MSFIKRGPVQSMILALEALLVIIGLSLGSGSQVCMSCYWVIILVYHVCEWINGVEKDPEDEETEAEHGQV